MRFLAEHHKPLTTGVDSFPGTGGNDTFTGAEVTYSDSATPTLTGSYGVLDSIAGGAGTDTLNVIVQGGGATYTTAALAGATVSGIEVVNIRAIQAAAADIVTLAATTMTGLTTANTDRSTSAVTVTALGAGGEFGMITSSGAFNAGYAAAATAAKLNVQSGVTGGDVTLTGTGVLSTTINSTGAANTLTSATLSATSTTLKIDATTALNAGGVTGAALKTITATGAASTGTTQTVAGSTNSAIKLGTLAATVTTVDASGMTAGGVSATLVAAVTSFKGGAGADAVTTVALTDSATASIIDGGAGTDTLVVGAYAHINTATKAKQYANFEVVDSAALTGTAIDMSLFTNSTITGLAIGVAAEASFSNVTAAQASNVTIYGDGATTTTIALKDAAVNGNLDTLTLKFNDGLAAVDTLTLASVVAAGTETINVVATDNAEITSLAASTAFNGMTVTGVGTVSITTGALAATANTVINASALTGAFTYVGTAATANGLKVTGSATAANSFTGATATTLGDVFIGGAAADTFVNNVTGQATTGGDIFTGGAGADTFLLRGNVASGVASTIYNTATRITDFTVGAGGDILSLSSTIANYSGATGFAGLTATTAVAAGATVVQSLAASSGAVALTAGAALLKLTTAVADTTSLQAMFNTAIGTSTVTPVTSGSEIFFSLYDSTNSRMVVGLVDSVTAAATTFDSGDIVTLIGSLNMTAADYALFTNANLSINVA